MTNAENLPSAPERISPGAMSKAAANAVAGWLTAQKRSNRWLGEQLGLRPPDNFTRLLDRTRPTRLDQARRIHEVTGIPLSVLVGSGEPPTSAPDPQTDAPPRATGSWSGAIPGGRPSRWDDTADTRPVYASAMMGDPRPEDEDAPGEYDRLPVPERAIRLGIDRIHCFAAMVEGDSMAGASIPPGAVVWCDVVPPARPRQHEPVLARVYEGEGDERRYTGMVVKRFKRGAGEDGQDCLASDRADGTREPLQCSGFEIVGVVRYVEHHAG